MSKPFKVVLVEPRIPQNTGNIGRLTAANHCEMHLVEPMAFNIDEKKVKRAGLDYWPEVNLTIHSNWEQFLSNSQASANNTWLLTTKADKPYTEANFQEGDFLIFGSEDAGLAPHIHEQFPERRITIPMANPAIRSLNLSNSVAIVLYEALRQTRQSE